MPRDIAIAADRGGVGKTTLAVHLARRFADLGRTTLLLDCDPSRAAVRWCDRQGSDDLPFECRRAFTGQNIDGPDVRVWDTPAHPGATMRESILGLDLVLIVVTLDPASLWAAENLVYSCNCAFPPTPHLLVVNAADQRAKQLGLLRRACAVREWPLAGQVVRRYACYQKAHWDQTTVRDRAYPNSVAAWQDICALTDEILAVLGDDHAEDQPHREPPQRQQ